MITTAALRLDDGLIITMPRPARHPDLINALSKIVDSMLEEQGFLTNTGEFLDRKQALIHARECGQQLIDENLGWGTELFSEMLY